VYVEIRDQLCTHIADPTTRGKLLLEKVDTTLDQIIEKALAFELAADSNKQLGLGGSQPNAAISHSSASVNVERVHGTRKFTSHPERGGSQQGRPSGGPTCYSCGKAGHVSRSPECPAKNQE
jgi:hypothetical protein